jgi:hypothetical protein
MSDYLDNLIAKSLGLAEVVAPRPASLFEPSRSEAGLSVHQYYSLEQDGSPQRTPADAGRSPDHMADHVPDHVMDVAAPTQSEDLSSEDAPPQLRAAQPAQPSQHTVQPIVQSVDRGASRPEPLLISNQPVAADAGRRADRAPSATPPPQQLADQRPSDQQMVLVESHHAAPVNAPLLIVSHSTIPAEPQVPGAPEAEPFAPAQAPGAPVTPSSPSGAKLVAPASLRRADQERVSASSDRAAIPKPATDATAPTIKITIGRVDVRAVTPDKESPRPAPPARNHALTLEEYLKRRSGGKI